MEIKKNIIECLKQLQENIGESTKIAWLDDKKQDAEIHDIPKQSSKFLWSYSCNNICEHGQLDDDNDLQNIGNIKRHTTKGWKCI